MKIVDTIFQFPSYRPSRDGICRVRIFVSEKQQVTVLLTELDGNTGPFVTNGIELIRNALLSRG
ncbi:MAG: DUF4263 domain-containing protein, partial [Bryobacteraceae bacterium]